MEYDYQELMNTLYMAIDSLRNGDVDEIEIVRETTDMREDRTEGFQLILRRDVLGRREAQKLEETLESLRESGG